MSSPRQRVPTYRRHRNSGQAVVTLSGRDFYLGPHGSKVSRLEYDRLVGEWLASSRCLPPGLDPGGNEANLAVSELLRAYWRFAKGYYVKDGRPTGEMHCIKRVIRAVRELYGHTNAAEFGPLALKAVRQKLIDEGLARTSTNQNVSRIKRIFKWGVSNELVPASVHQGLSTVAGLRRGRTEARETEPVKPVPDEYVDHAHRPADG